MWLQALREEGYAVPPPKEPTHPEVEVYADLKWTYNAFWRLSGCRPEGFNGALRIPVTEVNAWAQAHRMNRTQTLDLLFFIDAMDRAYMGWLAERRAEEDGKRQAVKRTQQGNITPQAPNHPQPRPRPKT